MKKRIKIAYIGGGSKMWARIFMSDLALTDDLSGEIALYDIDIQAANRNAKISKYINANPKCKSKFEYIVYEKLEEALVNADFVIISILPGTFEEMKSDVHEPEKYGIYQSVGDTVGPGGVLRSMRTVPLYEDFAMAIKKICPKAWVINFTNPMTICLKTLYDVFPKIKAFGCCHEVFHAQEFLCRVLKEIKNIDVKRTDIYTQIGGINHFTWINKATYKNIDILSLIPEFKERFYEEGYYEYEGKRFEFLTNPFAYGNKVKMDLYNKFECLAAAGDRHLVEFLPLNWYLKDKDTIKKFAFNLTTVDFRIKDMQEKIEDSILMAEGKKEFILEKSSEEAVEIIKAILGFNKLVSNVNIINVGQMKQLPLGEIIETNCVFKKNKIKPIKVIDFPDEVISLINRNLYSINECYIGIKNRNLFTIYNAFKSQQLCCNLKINESKTLFKTMCYNTRKYLDEYFDLEKLKEI